MRDFAYNIGITKYNGLTDVAVLEHAVREDLNRRAFRRLAVLRPLKVVLTNYPEGQVEQLEAVNNPEDPAAGTRKVPFCRELCIEQDDFMENPPPKYFRLRPGGEVRLKYGLHHQVRRGHQGRRRQHRRVALHRRPRQQNRRPYRESQGKRHHPLGQRPARHGRRNPAYTTASSPWPNRMPRAISRSFSTPIRSKCVTAKCEPSLKDAQPNLRYQFERLAYFTLDPDSTPGHLVFNRTITLKDTWAKEARKA